MAGKPAVRERPTGLTFEHETVGPLHLAVPLLDFRPVVRLARQLWVAVDRGGRRLRLDLDDASVAPHARLGDVPVDLDEPVALHLSVDGRFTRLCSGMPRR